MNDTLEKIKRTMPTHILFSYNQCYECECGGRDFWIVPQVPGLGSFIGMVCQKCEDLYLLPEPIARKDIYKFTKEEVHGKAKT
jgi:hypothetical protein